MRAIIAIEKLRLIGDLTSPLLPTGKFRAPGGIQRTMRVDSVGANKEPLSTAEMSLTGNQNDPLVAAADLDVEPSLGPSLPLMSAVMKPEAISPQ